jgi:predicted nucleic acid-binding protein
MTTRSFIDTNVLIYAEASDEPLKQRAAIALLKSLFLDGQGVLSTQILQEYCNVALKKLKLSAQHVRAQLDLYEQFEIVQVTPAIIHAGLDLHQTRSISFFDAVVLASAHASGCEVIWTEDMNTAEVINGVRIANPFMDSVAF